MSFLGRSFGGAPKAVRDKWRNLDCRDVLSSGKILSCEDNFGILSINLISRYGICIAFKTTS